jgi:hypothetical protein
MKELEKTIAEALQRYCPEGARVNIQIIEVQFDETLNRFDMKLSGWERHEPITSIRPI